MARSIRIWKKKKICRTVSGFFRTFIQQSIKMLEKSFSFFHSKWLVLEMIYERHGLRFPLQLIIWRPNGFFLSIPRFRTYISFVSFPWKRFGQHNCHVIVAIWAVQCATFLRKFWKSCAAACSTIAASVGRRVGIWALARIVHVIFIWFQLHWTHHFRLCFNLLFGSHQSPPHRLHHVVFSLIKVFKSRLKWINVGCRYVNSLPHTSWTNRGVMSCFAPNRFFFLLHVRIYGQRRCRTVYGCVSEWVD